MKPKKRTLLWIILVGGTAVLGSYAWGLVNNPGYGALLWGGVLLELRPMYTLSMLLAMLGYFSFTYFILYRLDAEIVRFAGRLKYTVFNALYVGILLPSALWMPLTGMMVESPGPGLWLAVRATLALVGLSSLGLVGVLIAVRPKESGWAYWLALLGAIVFCLHTGVLDAILWPALFLF